MTGVVYYDCTRLIERRKAVTPTGIDRVDIHYLNHLYKQNPDNIVGLVQYGSRIVALDPEDLFELRNNLALRWISEHKIEVPDSPILDRAYAHGKTLASSLEKLREQPLIHPNVISPLTKRKCANSVYINASHHGIDKESLMLAIKSQLKSKTLFFIHDIIPIDFPEYVAAGGDIIHKRRMNNVSFVADNIIVNSSYTKNRVEAYFKSNDLRVPNIDILYIGADSQFKNVDEVVENPLEGKKYFVSVGTIEPRKNHIMLLNIWRRWLEDEGDAPYLVLIGKRGWEIKTVTNMLDLSPALRSRVIEMSGLPDQSMVSILKGSQGLLFPTFVEGWGMPLAEALSLGVGVICSDIEVFKECGQNLPTYIDPMDAKAWYQELVKVNGSVALQKEMRANAAQYVSSDWQDHHKALTKIVEKLMSSKGGDVDAGSKKLVSSRLRSDADRIKSWSEYVLDKDQELIKTVPEVYKPNGKTFEDRFYLLGNVRCLRLSAEAYIEDGMTDDAVRVLELALKINPSVKNIKRRAAVVKYPILKKIYGKNRFEPYYYGKLGVI